VHLVLEADRFLADLNERAPDEMDDALNMAEQIELYSSTTGINAGGRFLRLSR
jgi:hypothetical protein